MFPLSHTYKPTVIQYLFPKQEPMWVFFNACMGHLKPDRLKSTICKDELVSSSCLIILKNTGCGILFHQNPLRNHQAEILSLKDEGFLPWWFWGGSYWTEYRTSVGFSCDQAALWMVFSVRLSICPSISLSVYPSVRPSHLFDYVPIIVSSWNFQELFPMTKKRSMQKVKVLRSKPNLSVSGP